MDYLQAVILAVVEGLTEFLPVSSTGHLVLASRLINLPQSDFVKSFELIIQTGAILAVLVLYWKRLLKSFRLWRVIVFGFLPAGILGIFLYDFIKASLIGNEWVTVTSLFLGGLVLLFFDKFHKEKAMVSKPEEISIKEALTVGLFQSVSMIPGVSRAAATIIGGLVVGMDRRSAVEYSFLLALPTIAGATALDLVKTDFSFTPEELSLLVVGFVGSFFTAVFAIKFLVEYVQKNNFVIFGIYRIVASLAYWFVFLR